MRIRYPMSSFRLHGSLGIIVHSHLALAMIKLGLQEIPTNAAVLKMPYQAGKNPIVRTSHRLGTVREVLVLGGVTENRGIIQILAALDSDPRLCEGIRVNFIGEKDPTIRIPVLPCLVFHGRKPDRVVREFFANVSMAINIRAPHLGECSYSLVGLLEAGIPVITSKFLLDCIGGKAPKNWRLLEKPGDVAHSAKQIAHWIQELQRGLIQSETQGGRDFDRLYGGESLRYARKLMQMGAKRASSRPFLTILVAIAADRFQGAKDLSQKYLVNEQDRILGGFPVEVVIVLRDAPEGEPFGKLQQVEGLKRVSVVRLAPGEDGTGLMRDIGKAFVIGSKLIPTLGRFVFLSDGNAFPNSANWALSMIHPMLDMTVALVCPLVLVGDYIVAPLQFRGSRADLPAVSLRKPVTSCTRSGAMVRGQDWLMHLSQLKETTPPELVLERFGSLITKDGFRAHFCANCLLDRPPPVSRPNTDCVVAPAVLFLGPWHVNVGFVVDMLAFIRGLCSYDMKSYSGYESKRSGEGIYEIMSSYVPYQACFFCAKLEQVKNSPTPVVLTSNHVSQAAVLFADNVPPDTIKVLRAFAEGPVQLTKEQKDHLLRLDDIWPPNEFVANTILAHGVSKERIFHVPAMLRVEFDHPPSKSASLEEQLGLKPSPGFRFLSVFEWTNRKGWAILVESFAREFGKNELVELVIKSSCQIHKNRNGPRCATFLQRVVDKLLAKVGLMNHARIIVVSLELSDMRPLYLLADAFVLPSRGEGIGLPALEAMAMALPVIGTNATGLKDFLTEQTGYPLRYKLAKVTKPDLFRPDRGFIYQNTTMTFVDMDHLRDTMRYVYQHRDKAREIGQQAQRYVFRYHHWKEVSRIVAKRLEQLVVQKQTRALRTSKIYK
jgi:glycosyltransferase involved in cell wall biosynthesis